MSEHWTTPEGGKFFVANRSKLYESLTDEVDHFFGRPLARESHYYTCEDETYAVFFFREKSEADTFVSAFEGETFDPRDVGRGIHWMIWYRGKTAKRMKNRSPYDCR